jgi:hypothetical protein
VLTETELLRLTELELLGLLRQASNELATLREHAPDRENALINLRRINRTLGRFGPSPGRPQ